MTQGETLEELEEKLEMRIVLMVLEDVPEKIRRKQSPMKRSEFVRQLLADGYVLPTHAQNTTFTPIQNKRCQVHTEIDDVLAKHIRKRLGLTNSPLIADLDS